MKFFLCVVCLLAFSSVPTAFAIEKGVEDLVGPDGAIAATSITAFKQSIKLFEKKDKNGLKTMLNEGTLVNLKHNEHVTRVDDKWKNIEMGGEIPLTKIRYKGKVYWTMPNLLVNGISGYVQNSIQQQNQGRTASDLAQEKKLRGGFAPPPIAK